MLLIPLETLLHGARIIALVCNQYGDTGKGKFSDYFASQWADVIARGTGGNNAGHTVVVNGTQKVFHLLPAGILHDREGKVNILGNGMVIDLGVLCHELEALDEVGLPYEHLMISKDAHIIMRHHVEDDKSKNASQKNYGVGTTGRGIGPCYADKIARYGILIGDLLSRDRLVQKVERMKNHYPLDLQLSVDGILSEFGDYIEKIRPFIRDTVTEMHHFVKQGKHILLEGAQGLLLSIEHGTYPYVTSSDCSVNGTASGVGISARAIDLVFGIVKFPFMTRVGGGPFPTELGGATSESYCGEEGVKHTRELEYYGVPYTKYSSSMGYDHHDSRILTLMNSLDPLKQGIGIRLAAGEYGATTGRPRRIGWTDAVAAKYAIGINGPLQIILTKADAVAGI